MHQPLPNYRIHWGSTWQGKNMSYEDEKVHVYCQSKGNYNISMAQLEKS